MKFKITYFSNGTGIDNCQFEIKGPQLSYEHFSTVYKRIQDLVYALNKDNEVGGSEDAQPWGEDGMEN